MVKFHTTTTAPTERTTTFFLWIDKLKSGFLVITTSNIIYEQNMINFIKNLFKSKAKKIAELEEQKKWDEFQESCNKRKEKHKRNLHKSATGCQVGLKWSIAEDLKVIKALGPHTTLMSLSEISGRPIFGITSRITKRYGLFVHDRFYNVYPKSIISSGRVRNMPSEVVVALKEKGWKEDDRRNLRAPDWFRNMTIRKY